MEIVLLSSEPNPYELAFIYEILIFYNFMTANCKITHSGFNRIKLYLVDFILVNKLLIKIIIIIIIINFFLMNDIIHIYF